MGGTTQGDAGGGGANVGEGDQSGAGAGAVGGMDVGGRGGTSGTSDGGAAGGGAGGSEAGTGGSGGTVPVVPSGAIVGVDGSCLGVAKTRGDVVRDPTAVHRQCADDPALVWSFDQNAHLRAAVEDAFLEVGGSPGDTGAIVRVAAPVAPAADNQQWAFDGVFVKNGGGLCIDVPFGVFEDRAPVQVYRCQDGASQSWTITALGQIRHDAFCLDLPGSAAEIGTRIQVFTCYDVPPDNQRFFFDRGRILPRNTGKCIGTAGDPMSDQTPLEVQLCSVDGPSAIGQTFALWGPIKNLGLCLDIGTRDVGAPDPVTLEACTGAPEQTWTWFF